MTVTRILTAIVLVLAAAAAAAQTSGAAISVPLPIDPKRLAQYDIVELAGARAADEAMLEGPRSPLVVEYVTVLASIRQRLAIYENGLVEVDLEGTGADLRKRVVIPEDAVTEYEKFFATCDLETFTPWDAGDPARNQVVLRLGDGAAAIERRFRATTVVPAHVERLRQVLHDVLRALCEDRTATNPIANYEPVVGDVLIADDQKTYRIVRLINDGEYTELLNTKLPLRLVVTTADLHLYFIGLQPRHP
ncbi:MAG: hypothetical protein ACRD2J_12950 [Thermoanaerobaculia bacterium]